MKQVRDQIAVHNDDGMYDTEVGYYLMKLKVLIGLIPVRDTVKEVRTQIRNYLLEFLNY